MTAEPLKSCIICATPRTGSTLLCEMLKSSGVAGKPESYFRQQDLTQWAEKWDILRSGDTFAFQDYLKSAIAAGQSENGVFAARIMWGTMRELADNIAGLHPREMYADKEYLERAFGSCRFVYLKRLDVIAQAVSLLRAEQTDLWHVSGQEEPAKPEQEPEYDFGRIHGFVNQMNEHNAQWDNWFRTNGIHPHAVTYEDVSNDPAGETGRVLDYLGLELPQGNRFEAGSRRLSGKLNEEWIERYRAESGRGKAVF